jgi:2-oxoglutarate ferredoxin oxidoreductase subunit alpha
MSNAPSPATSAPDGAVVNDFSLQVATANGSGSQTANNVLLRSIFRMGVPVSGKNLFPSNIQGLPTWFTIRASRHGYIGRKRELDVLVLLNPETAAADALAAAPGTSVVYERKLAVEALRDDLRLFPVPFSDLAAKLPLPAEQSKLRRLLVNMVYVGVLSDLMGIDPAEIEAAIRRQLGGKARAIDLNLAALNAGRDYSAATFPEKLPHRVERMDATAGKVILDGNSASAMGCLFGGATVCTWYPITPSSSLCETFIELCDRHRTEAATGRTAAAIVQAEDEIASIGMVLGAGWAGARAFTATSGPGISLMSELIGYGYYAEIPAVIFDVQRVGPSTGLPTRTMQADVLLCHTSSHGDGRHPVLFPASPEECFTMAQEAFDLAERLQTPVFVLTDLDLGMNNWMADPFAYPEKPFDRGKVLDAEGVERLKETWGRYRDLDGDGIPWRTLPGTDHPRAAFFTRGSGHDERAAYTEKPDDYVRNVERLARKLQTGRALLPRPVVEDRPGARAGLLAFGTSHYGTTEGRDRLEREHGLPLDYLRLRALPLGDEARAWIERHEVVYVVEQNRDAQLAGLLREALPSYAARLVSVLQYDGLPLDATTVVDGVLAHVRPTGGAR